MSRRRKAATVPEAAAPAPAPAKKKASPIPKTRKPRAAKPANPAAATSGTTAAPLAAAAAAPALAAPAPRLLLRAPMAVRWRDLDAFSHVNNSTFLTYVEEARLQWFQSLPGPWVTEDTAPVLAATHVNYRRPIEWPEQLVVELYAERVGNTSLTVAHRIVATADADVLYSDGYSVLVWIDRRGGKAAALPEAVRQAATPRAD
jgi:acyl-CoA thioester hydrolase